MSGQVNTSVIERGFEINGFIFSKGCGIMLMKLAVHELDYSTRKGRGKGKKEVKIGQSHPNFANLPEAEAIRLKGQSALKDAGTQGALASFALSAWGFSPKLTGNPRSIPPSKLATIRPSSSDKPLIAYSPIIEEIKEPAG